ncbi:pyridoxal phosphate-dependent transferase [Mrakia frigida]|uniref:pyridoxal phosphate-dependent transferase n=1 Tax=Mrakia frigida TaxID=29902 RepID=UPI003FCBFEEC
MSPAAILPHSLDLSKHYSHLTASRSASQVKALGFLASQPGYISLAGGKPQPNLFPLSSAKFTVPSFGQLGSEGLEGWKSGEDEGMSLELFKGKEGGVVDLERGLQYAGGPNGFSELTKPLMEVMKLVHNPPYADATVVLTLGASDGISKTFQLFANHDGTTNVLAERCTFGSAINTGRQAFNIKFWPIEMDGEGLLPESLDSVMTNWDVSKQGQKPGLLYTIPCGQNPTGSVPSDQRYQEIYELGQKHDLIIMEDDPYYWLQYQPYVADLDERAKLLDEALGKLPPTPSHPSEEDLGLLAEAFNGFAGVRSHLSRDVDGRVVRLDTFSKIFAPGLRMGWIVCNEKFAERIYRIAETSTQPPSCLTQSLLASYLSPDHGWGTGGFLRWISGVRTDYQKKRDSFLDSLAKFAPEEYVSTTHTRGGMFFWLKFAIEKHPRYTPATGSAPSNVNALTLELFQAFLDEKLVLYPGSGFSIEAPGEEGKWELPYHRCTFAGNIEGTEKGLEVLGKVVKVFFEVAK